MITAGRINVLLMFTYIHHSLFNVQCSMMINIDEHFQSLDLEIQLAVTVRKINADDVDGSPTVRRSVAARPNADVSRTRGFSMSAPHWRCGSGGRHNRRIYWDVEKDDFIRLYKSL